MKKHFIITHEAVEQQNPFYDERKAANGGGYDQPLTIIEFVYGDEDGEREYRLSHNEDSCGDFGRRWSVALDSRIDDDYVEDIFFYEFDEVGDAFENIMINEKYRDLLEELSNREELKKYFPKDSFDEIKKRV